MKNTSLFNAASICLTAVDAEKDAPAFAAWTQDSRFISFAGESKASKYFRDIEAAKDYLVS